ncbi:MULTISPECIES: hypothetical protein [Streptomyces]|uniref:Secreted protein n=1 Tax=Streptomyces virginiae TaxID=1961 RepID=A0ABZ1T7G6_STRVG|nr:hypothetical protein [Streptomyces virginiae]WTB20355.1 hypothetical protein OG253_01955 [Streptomyces virginiae]
MPAPRSVSTLLSNCGCAASAELTLGSITSGIRLPIASAANATGHSEVSSRCSIDLREREFEVVDSVG